jgi:hypothetical protein
MRGWKMLIVLVCLLRTVDTSAQVTWRRSLGGYGSDVAKSVRVTSDGNYVVCGSTGSFGAGGGDIYLVLLDPNGEIIWSKTYGGTGVEQGNCVRETADGGFIIAGLTNSFGAGGYDGYVVRTDASGLELWSETFGGSDWDEIYSIEVDPIDGFIAAGRTYSSGLGGADGWLLSIAEEGGLDWERTYGSTNSDFLRDVALIDAGGYVVVGGTDSIGTMDSWVMTVDVAGDVVWTAIDGGDSLDYGVDILQTIDGGFSIIGTTESYSPWTEMYHYKLDGTGLFQWFFHWGQTGNQEGFEHVQLSDGRLVSICYNRAVGNGGADYFLLFTDPQGNFIQAPSYGGSEDELGYSVASTLDGGFILAGTTDTWGFGVQDIWMLKTDSAGQTASMVVEEEFDALVVLERKPPADFVLWPSPAPRNADVHISATNAINSVYLFNALGNPVFNRTYAPDREILVQLEDLSMSAGVYSVLVVGENWKSVSMLVVTAP